MREFLKEQLGDKSFTYSTEEIQESLYLQESARIPVSGMQQTLYPDLVMTAPVYYGGRTEEYKCRFKNGTAKWYHTRLSTFKKKAQNHLPNEVRFLALATGDDGLNYIWNIEKTTIVSAEDLTIEHTGKVNRSSGDKYILFQLGNSKELQRTIKDVWNRKTENAVHFLKLFDLLSSEQIEDIKRHSFYKDFLKT